MASTPTSTPPPTAPLSETPNSLGQQSPLVPAGLTPLRVVVQDDDDSPKHSPRGGGGTGGGAGGMAARAKLMTGWMVKRPRGTHGTLTGGWRRRFFVLERVAAHAAESGATV